MIDMADEGKKDIVGICIIAVVVFTSPLICGWIDGGFPGMAAAFVPACFLVGLMGLLILGAGIVMGN